MTLETELQQSIAEYQPGHCPVVEEFSLSILPTQPCHTIANHNPGLLEGQAARHETGRPYLRKSLPVDPGKGQFRPVWKNSLPHTVQREQTSANSPVAPGDIHAS